MLCKFGYFDVRRDAAVAFIVTLGSVTDTSDDVVNYLR